jgi:hypothetical protein
VLLWLVAVAGLLWADAPVTERLGAFGSFQRLLVIPLLFVQFRTSLRGEMVALGFLLSEAALLLVSFAHAALWDILPWHIGAIGGVPVKSYITQSELFEVCGFALLGLAVETWRDGGRRRAMCLLLLATAFFCDILYVATGRSALVGLPVLTVLFGLRYFGSKGVLGAVTAGVVVATISWTSSPYLRFRVEHAVEEVRDYESSGLATSSGVRLEFWRKAVRFIAEAPILGHGTGSINGLYRRAQVDDGSAAAIMAENPHQQILTVAIQLGLFGAAVLIAMWLAHCVMFYLPGFVAWAGLVVVVQNLVSSMFNSHLFDFTEGWFYVFGVGVLGGIVLRERSKPAASQPASQTAQRVTAKATV